jgi:hypothetical protein
MSSLIANVGKVKQPKEENTESYDEFDDNPLLVVENAPLECQFTF